MHFSLLSETVRGTIYTNVKEHGGHIIVHFSKKVQASTKSKQVAMTISYRAG